MLTLAEAAVFLRLEEGALAAAVDRGEIPGRRLLGEWRFSRAALIAWLAGADRPSDCFPPTASTAAPTAAPAGPSEDRLSRRELGTVSGAGVSGAAAPAVAQAPEQVPGTFGEEPELDTARDIALREQVVLLRAGEMTLEAGLFYARTDRNLTVVAPPGVPVVGRQKQEAFTAALTGRYGVIDNLQLVASLPFSFTTTELTVGAQTLAETSRDRLGDVGLSARYALLREGVRRPSVIASADGRIPTDGSGAYALGAGVSLVKSIDPTALFASINYLHTFNADARGLTELQPEDTVNATFGFAFAMNERLSFGVAVNAAFDRRTEFDGVVLPAEETYNLRLSLTSLLTESFYVEPSVSFRLTGPEDAVTFGLSLPYTFRF